MLIRCANKNILYFLWSAKGERLGFTGVSEMIFINQKQKKSFFKKKIITGAECDKQRNVVRSIRHTLGGDDVLLHLLRVDDQAVPDEHCRLARDNHLRRRRPGYLVQVG